MTYKYIDTCMKYSKFFIYVSKSTYSKFFIKNAYLYHRTKTCCTSSMIFYFILFHCSTKVIEVFQNEKRCRNGPAISLLISRTNRHFRSVEAALARDSQLQTQTELVLTFQL